MTAPRSGQRSALPTRQPPTHTLVIEVSLHMDGADDLPFDALRDALRIALSLSRLAAAGLLCDGPQVTLKETE